MIFKMFFFHKLIMQSIDEGCVVQSSEKCLFPTLEIGHFKVAVGEKWVA